MILDLEMPVLDGAGAAKRIREIERTGQRRAIPILGLTGHKPQDVWTECTEAGMNDVFMKPITKQNVLNLLLKYTSKPSL